MVAGTAVAEVVWVEELVADPVANRSITGEVISRLCFGID